MRSEVFTEKKENSKTCGCVCRRENLSDALSSVGLGRSSSSSSVAPEFPASQDKWPTSSDCPRTPGPPLVSGRAFQRSPDLPTRATSASIVPLGAAMHHYSELSNRVLLTAFPGLFDKSPVKDRQLVEPLLWHPTVRKLRRGNTGDT